MIDDAGVADLVILDVGHGNTAVLRSSAQTVVIDAAPSHVVVEELERESCDRVDHLMLSHADKDHIGGAIALLSHSDFPTSHLWLNPDGEKGSAVWGDLLALAGALSNEGKLKVVTSLNSASNPIVSSDEFVIDVVHPDLQLAARGPVAAHGPFGRVSSNAASAVLRISHLGKSMALLAGDANAFAVRRMLDLECDLRAEVLVFPHHGGRSGGDDYEFALELCRAVQPSEVIFSLSRSGFANPQPEIVRGVKDGAPGARIACTQLSTHCCSSQPVEVSAAAQWLDLPAAGKISRSRCAGTLRVRSDGSEVKVWPTRAVHKTIIDIVAPGALCVR